jgi:hypothetical protein
MKQKVWTMLAAALLGCWVLDAQAQVVGIGAKLGTQGVGADVTVRLLPRLNLRAGVNYFDVGLNVDLDEASVEGALQWLNFPVLLDVHPFGGGFRLSLGVVLNETELKMSASPNETLEFEGTEYELLGLDGNITFPGMNYYLGIGYGNAVSRDGRWHFVFDLGVVYAGSLNADATATAADPALQDALNSDLRTSLDSMEEDTKGLVMYPALSLGLSYGF